MNPWKWFFSGGRSPGIDGAPAEGAGGRTGTCVTEGTISRGGAERNVIHFDRHPIADDPARRRVARHGWDNEMNAGTLALATVNVSPGASPPSCRR